MSNSSGPAPNLWRRNLAALRYAYPELASRVQNASTHHVFVQPTSRPPFHVCRLFAADGTPLSRGREGWIHGPGDPKAEAREAMTRLVQQDVDLFVLVQSGLGHVLHLLCQRLAGLMLQRGCEPLLIIVEEDFGVFRKCLELRAWENILRSPRVFLLVGRSFHQALVDLARTRSEAFVGRRAIFCAGSHLSQEESARLSEISRIVQGKATDCEQQLLTRCQAMRERRFPGRSMPRIVLFSHYFRSIQRQLQKGFQQLGWDCRLLTWPREEQFIRTWAWVDVIERNQPDVLIFLNETPEQATENFDFPDLPIPKIVWFYDDPLRSIDYPPRPIRRGERDTALGFDPSFRPILSSLGFRQVATLRAATGFSDLPDVSREKVGRITYVGNLPVAGVRFFERGLLGAIRPELLPVIDEGVDFLLANPEESLIEWLEGRLPHGCGVARRHFYLAIQDKATWRRRRAFLEPLSDLGLSLYGPDTWADAEIAGPLTRSYTGRMVDYDTELPRVYALSPININLFHVQCRRATNARIYDVLACGGFLITDDNPGLREEFTNGEHLVVACSPEEMREKALFYLERPEERKRVADAGRQLVLGRDTYRRRLQELLDVAGLSDPKTR